MSVWVIFRVSTGQSLDGDAPGTGGAIDISKKLSLVGSIPELGAWSLNKRVPIRRKPDLGEKMHMSPMADTRIARPNLSSLRTWISWSKRKVLCLSGSLILKKIHIAVLHLVVSISRVF